MPLKHPGLVSRRPVVQEDFQPVKSVGLHFRSLPTMSRALFIRSSSVHFQRCVSDAMSDLAQLLDLLLSEFVPSNQSSIGQFSQFIRPLDRLRIDRHVPNALQRDERHQAD